MIVLQIMAKCNDCCDATIFRNGEPIYNTDGYVPSLMPGGGGDYIKLSIDIETGKILNWVVPTKSQLEEFTGINFNDT